jgi:hypothetical protein
VRQQDDLSLIFTDSPKPPRETHFKWLPLSFLHAVLLRVRPSTLTARGQDSEHPARPAFINPAGARNHTSSLR